MDMNILHIDILIKNDMCHEIAWLSLEVSDGSVQK